jgi:hypothetical protein
MIPILQLLVPVFPPSKYTYADASPISPSYSCAASAPVAFEILQQKVAPSYHNGIVAENAPRSADAG